MGLDSESYYSREEGKKESLNRICVKLKNVDYQGWVERKDSNLKQIIRNLKKIISLMIISCTCIAMLGTSVLATESSGSEVTPTLQEMRNYLLSIGTEQEFLDDIDANRIEKLYWKCIDKDVSFLGYDTEIVEIQESDPRLRGQISTSKLKLGIAVYEMTSNGKVTGLNISTVYEWISDPILHRTDAHTFTFDGNKFMVGGMYAESGYMVSTQWLRVDFVDTPAKAADGGIGWYLSIGKGTDLPKSITNSGGAEIYLIPRNGSATKEQLHSSMYYTYAHQIPGASISFGTSGGSVSISGGSYDYQTKILNY